MASCVPPGKLKKLNEDARGRGGINKNQVAPEVSSSVVAKDDSSSGVDLLKVLFFKVSAFFNAIAMFFR